MWYMINSFVYFIKWFIQCLTIWNLIGLKWWSPFQSATLFVLIHPAKRTIVLWLLALFERIVSEENIVVTLLLVFFILVSLRSVKGLLLWFWSESKYFIRFVQYFISDLHLFPVRKLALRGLTKVRIRPRFLITLSIFPKMLILRMRGIPQIKLKRTFLRNRLIMSVRLVIIHIV